MAQTWKIVRITDAPYPDSGSRSPKLYQNGNLVRTLVPGIMQHILIEGQEVQSGSYGVGITGSDGTIVRLGKDSTATFVVADQRLVISGQFVLVGPKQSDTYISNIGVVEARRTCNVTSQAVYVITDPRGETDPNFWIDTYYSLTGQSRISELFGASGTQINDAIVNLGFKLAVQNIDSTHQVGIAEPMLSEDFTPIAKLLGGFWTVIDRRGADNILPTSTVTQTFLLDYIA